MRRIVALGDSLTAGWGVRYGAGWVERLMRLFPEDRFYNAGLPGDTTDGMLRRLPRCLKEGSPEILLFMGGTNDLLMGRTAAEVLENVRSIQQTCRRESVPPELILFAPPEISRDPGPFAWFTPQELPRLTAELSLLRQKLSVFAQENGLRCYDFSQVFSEEDYEELLLPDGIHLKEAAHECMAQAVFSWKVL